ncbi:MAG: glycosyltransferase [Mycoplasmatales bacterium]
MKDVMIVHGYLLSGTGSNLYVKSITKYFLKQGVNVHLVCQEYNPENFDFINCYQQFDLKTQSFKEVFSRETSYPGKCTLYKPDLDGILPVFVYDKYPNYDVYEMHKMEQSMLEAFISKNQNAVEQIFKTHSISHVFSNHIVLQPLYVIRALKQLNLTQEVIHNIIVHGSDLHFSIKESKIIEDYAFEAIYNVNKIFFVSNSSEAEFNKHFNQLKQALTTEIVCAGVELEDFHLPYPDDKAELIKLLQTNKSNNGFNQMTREQIVCNVKNSTISIKQHEIIDIKALEENIDLAIANIDDSETVITFVGKYLETKGIHSVLLAAPLLIEKIPNLKLVFTGFGEQRIGLEYLYQILIQNNYLLLQEVLNNPELIDVRLQTNKEIFKHFSKMIEDEAFLTNYFKNSSLIKDRIIFTGYFDHHFLSKFLPNTTYFIAPSVFSEAFGLVAAEAMACGVFPILAYQSGFKEIVDNLDQYLQEIELTNPLQTKLIVDENYILNIAECLINLKSNMDQLTIYERELLAKKLIEHTTSEYTWSKVVANLCK